MTRKNCQRSASAPKFLRWFDPSIAHQTKSSVFGPGSSALRARATQHNDTVLIVPHLLIEVARTQSTLSSFDAAAIALAQAEALIAEMPDPGYIANRISELCNQYRLHTAQG